MAYPLTVMTTAALSKDVQISLLRLAVVLPDYIPSTREVETGRLYVQGQPQLHSKTLPKNHN